MIGLTEYLGIKPSPVSPIAAGDSALIAGTIRLDGVAWITAKEGLTWFQKQAVKALQTITSKLSNNHINLAHLANLLRDIHMVTPHILAREAGPWVRQAWSTIH
eukprot:10200557-Heterocapsa_arctica.AAC.2